MSDARTRSTRELLDIVGAAPSASSAATRRIMIGNRRRDSRAEVELRRLLHARGRRYRVDHPIRVPGRRPMRPDIVFTRARIAVFVDGCFWHGCPTHATSPRANASYWAAKIELNQRRDREQAAALEANGWRVVRIWEHESPSTAADRIEALLASSGR